MQKNVWTPNFIKEQLSADKLILRDFNTPLSSLFRSSKNKNQRRNVRAKLYLKTNRLSKYLLNFSRRQWTHIPPKANGTFSTNATVIAQSTIVTSQHLLVM